jgi:hypothetical protein
MAASNMNSQGNTAAGPNKISNNLLNAVKS